VKNRANTKNWKKRCKGKSTKKKATRKWKKGLIKKGGGCSGNQSIEKKRE